VTIPNPATDYILAGQIRQFTYGNGVAATFTYNQRLQLASLRYVNGSTDLLNLAYDYGAQNNGQIKKITYHTSPGVEDQTKSQEYTYDAWSRLRMARTTDITQPSTWRLEWDYDRFGNRRNQNLTDGNTSVTTPQLSISATTNRIDTPGYVYDAAGNLTNDSLHAYTYDGENRIKNTDLGSPTNQNVYTYSGPMRVKKAAGNPATTTTVYIFSGSKVIAEYVNGTLSREYVYSGSTLIATHEGPTGATLRYHHPDHLGTRVDTDTNGSWTRKFGHFPFGESWYEDVQGNGAPSKLKFTSYERDSESGLDQAMFRYESPRLGRFMSADPLAGRLPNPQSLNRYSYVLNNPVNLIDPLGLQEGCQWVCVPDANGNIKCTKSCPDGSGGSGGGGGRFPDSLGSDPMLDFLRYLIDSGFWDMFPGPEVVEAAAPEPSRNLVRFSKNCLSVFNKIWPGFSEAHFQALLKATPILNARDSLTALLSVAQIVGPTGNSADNALLGSVVPAGRGASVITGPWGAAIVTGPNFYVPGDLNANLIHEGLHVYTGYGDQALFDAFKPYGLRDRGSGTHQISEWINNDCR
jgi:RHS repeat-associated protein